MNNEQTGIAHIIVVGGGFGGLEAALYLRRRLGEQARITLVSDAEAFTFRPHLVYVPFGFTPEQAQLNLRELASAKQIAFLEQRVQGIDPERKALALMNGSLVYDYLIIATGAHAVPSTLPGLEEATYAVWSESDLLLMRNAFERLRYGDPPTPRQVVFLVPPGSQWAGPLYEMAFMLAQWLEWGNARSGSTLRFLTHEPTYMEALSADLHDTLAQEFEQHGILAETNRCVQRVDTQTLLFDTGEPVGFDLLIISPTYQGLSVWAPLPRDAQGFLQTVPETRQVQGWENIYAIGDGSDYPVKQAFLALLQADAAAEHLAAKLMDTQPAFSFKPSSLWVMEEFGQALVAHVPLDTSQASDANGDSSEAEIKLIPPGLLQRMALRDHLPLQSRISNPLYAGLLWKGLRTGVGLLPYLMKQEDMK